MAPPRTAMSPVALAAAVRAPADQTEALAVDIRDVRKFLPIGRSSVYRLINDGELETMDIGRRRLVVVRSIRALVERRARRAAAT